jgi:hypothetical protein
LSSIKDEIWKESTKGCRDSFHDVVFEATGEDLDEYQLKRLFVCLPSSICHEALEWGISDTLVRESIYRFLKERNEQQS